MIFTFLLEFNSHYRNKYEENDLEMFCILFNSFLKQHFFALQLIGLQVLSAL